MKNAGWFICLTVAFVHWMAASPVLAEVGPYVQGRFQGRIAYSCDGNHNDPDDWAASPVTLAILAEAGLKERLVHFDYNCILPLTDPEWEKIHAASVLGAAERYGFDKGRFFDCRKDRDGAVASIAKAIDDSTAADPLYFIIAGPMEVPYLGIQKSDPAKRQFVYCISHSRWNDGFASRYKFTCTKRSVIEQDVHWVQIRDQNRLLSFGRYGRPPAWKEFEPYFWMRDSADTRVRWLWERMVVSARPDPSDAGMTWFLATGDEECDPVKLRRLIDEHRCPAPVTARQQVRIEAENFRHLEGCALEDRNDKQASHALNTRLAGGNSGCIRTRFDEPFTRDSASYDVEIRYFDAKDSRCRLALSVNGAAQGTAWESPGEGRGWMSRTIREVAIRRGDEIRVDVRGDDPEAGKLDYVQLNDLAATAAALAFAGAAAAADDDSREPFVSAVRAFADTVLTHGRDHYGPQKTPLFVDGLEVESLEPARWQNSGQTWVLSNFASQQPLFRLLDGLTGLTGEPRYRQAAEQAARYALKYLQTPNGLLYWGGHLAWDLEMEKPVGQGADTHELKTHQPYFELMWRVEPEATRRLMETIWAGHVLDWERLDYNRHANARKRVRPQWDAAFLEDIEVPFPAEGGHLSFANVTPPLLRAGTMLAVLGDDGEALTWTRRLLHRWQQGKDPRTGLCGGQLSYRADDRARDALGHVHPEINEAKIVASYHQTSRYHHLPLAQMQAGEALIAAGGERAGQGREFIRWALADLAIYAQRSYDLDSGTFLALMTDGTSLRWQEAKTGYYVPESFAPLAPDGVLLWAYATACRLGSEEVHWRMARTIAKALDLGEIGERSGARALRYETDQASWHVIYALLELHRVTGDRQFLQLARRVGENVAKLQTPSGLFPRPGRTYARTGDEVPLALLHLAAHLAGQSSVLPPPTLDSRFFHCEYHGPLAPHQQKRADKRTYDHLVYYGGP